MADNIFPNESCCSIRLQRLQNNVSYINNVITRNPASSATHNAYRRITGRIKLTNQINAAKLANTCRFSTYRKQANGKSQDADEREDRGKDQQAQRPTLRHCKILPNLTTTKTQLASVKTPPKPPSWTPNPETKAPQRARNPRRDGSGRRAASQLGFHSYRVLPKGAATGLRGRVGEVKSEDARPEPAPRKMVQQM